jgi:hypothetical protein
LQHPTRSCSSRLTWCLSCRAGRLDVLLCIVRSGCVFDPCDFRLCLCSLDRTTTTNRPRTLSRLCFLTCFSRVPGYLTSAGDVTAKQDHLTCRRNQDARMIASCSSSILASQAPSHSHSSKSSCPIPLDVLIATETNLFSETTVSTDTLEFLQRPNSGDELPVAAPIEPLGGGDPHPDTEPVKAPEPHHAKEETKEEAPAPAKEQTPAPAPKSEPAPAQEEPKSNGAPVESKQEDSSSADMSYADVAAQGPEQTNEEK